MEYYIGSAKFISLKRLSNIGYRNIGKTSCATLMLVYIWLSVRFGPHEQMFKVVKAACIQEIYIYM